MIDDLFELFLYLILALSFFAFVVMAGDALGFWDANNAVRALIDSLTAAAP